MKMSIRNTDKFIEVKEYSIGDISIGCMVMVKARDESWQMAKILQTSDNLGKFVHFIGHNKRLDCWVTESRIDLTKPLYVPKARGLSLPGAQASGSEHGTSMRSFNSISPVKLVQESSLCSDPNNPGTLNRHQGGQEELRKQRSNRLRSLSGRRTRLQKDKSETPRKTQSANSTPVAPTDRTTRSSHSSSSTPLMMLDISKAARDKSCIEQVPVLRKIKRIQLGNHEIIPWYFSPYPEHFSKLPLVYICEFCLTYRGDQNTFIRHRIKCKCRCPPGDEIYRKDNLSIFQVDGNKTRNYCENLCLLSKLFLDDKNVDYDTSIFNFYVLTTNHNRGCQIIGYFSKLKEPEQNNLACILTLPNHQKKGYGRLLIEFSYQLSVLEGKTGDPEKPLSDLGFLSYKSYWSSTISEFLIKRSESGNGSMSVNEISVKTGITEQDVRKTLEDMNALSKNGDQDCIIITNSMVQACKKLETVRRIDPTCIELVDPILLQSKLNEVWRLILLELTPKELRYILIAITEYKLEKISSYQLNRQTHHLNINSGK